MSDATTNLAQFLYGQLPKFSPAGAASGALTVSTTSAQTGADTNETDLWTYSLPANTLSANGKGVRVTAWGNKAANANTVTPRLYFGATVLASASIVTSGAVWRITADVLRTGASAETAFATIMYAASGNDSNFVPSRPEPAADTTAAITIKVTGQNGTASAGDIVFRGAIVELIG